MVGDDCRRAEHDGEWSGDARTQVADKQRGGHNFNTNLFAHPYHGNLYFNAARTNGMNFWQSYPFALGGSLMWEFLGENTPPSINDLLATSIGGTAIGETTSFWEVRSATTTT